MQSQKTMLVALFLCMLTLFACKKEVPTEQPPNAIDTTSHNFSWQIDTLGDGRNSILYDVAIINDTLAYAVGEIYLRDSTGQIDPTPYNLAKRNGRSWSPRRVTVLFRANLITPILYGVTTFSASDIWLAGGMTIHGDGLNWGMIRYLLPNVGERLRLISIFLALSDQLHITTEVRGNALKVERDCRSLTSMADLQTKFIHVAAILLLAVELFSNTMELVGRK